MKGQLAEELFRIIVGLVANGSTIQKACKSAGISAEVFYYHITKQQKAELDMARISTKTFSIRGRGGDPVYRRLAKDLMVIGEDEDEF